MRLRLLHRVGAAIEGRVPERRVFLRTDTDTRFIRLSPVSQILGIGGSALILGWAIIATAILLMDSIGSGNLREQARREQQLYEERLNNLSIARDTAADEALQAQERFDAALSRVSAMQTALLAAEDRRKELETGIEAVQDTLRRTIKERDAARAQVALLEARLDGTAAPGTDPSVMISTYEGTIDALTAQLTEVSLDRDMMQDAANLAESEKQKAELDRLLLEQRNAQIFGQLETAMSVSLTPLDNMFKSVGLDPDKIIGTVRRGYSGTGGPLLPITFSTMNGPEDPDAIRANAILNELDTLNIYRIALQKVPLSMPLRTSFRYTSPFGRRWGKMHEGIDMAGSYGSPVYATADGVVTEAGWSNGYGRLVTIQHDFGLETRYGHLSQIRVTNGQRVSRGDRIGDMGSSGRSTGTHLHYEIRVGKRAIDPMTYIKAVRNVF